MIQKYDVVRLRSRLSLSQEKFAEKLGVSVSSVAKWETGWHKPRGLSLRMTKSAPIGGWDKVNTIIERAERP